MGRRPGRDQGDLHPLVLIETSAWVEFLRQRRSAVYWRVDALLEGGAASCEPVHLEVLAGARNARHERDLERLLAATAMLPTAAEDFVAAAALYRSCRRGGETVRSLLDCMIAAVAIRHDVPVLHADRDFDALARHTALRVEQP